jgi:hypothetical protein
MPSPKGLLDAGVVDPEGGLLVLEPIPENSPLVTGVGLLAAPNKPLV